jgi:hypothetical protein
VRTAFLQWAKKSFHPVSNADLAASTKDLQPIEKMIGEDINGYGDVKEPERDALTAAIADLVSLMERQQFAYIAIPCTLSESNWHSIGDATSDKIV